MKNKKSFHAIRRYFIPAPSQWPILGSLSLFFILVGVINILHTNWYGHYLLAGGLILLIFMLQGWFSVVIHESTLGLHSKQMDRTYRWGMVWFIASEVAFFSAFFGVLFYARIISVPTLGGIVGSGETHKLLWPGFQSVWPLLTNPNPTLFKGPHEVISTWGIPALNTFILLSSAVAVTWAHWALEKNNRQLLNLGLMITIVLGLLFVSLQAYEYHEAYSHMQLTLSSGIYGTTFFMLTGFHALHVTLGLIMLMVIFIRCLKGHFQPEHQFGFEAVSWYWHFVDVIWLFLFVFVYWL